MFKVNKFFVIQKITILLLLIAVLVVGVLVVLQNKENNSLENLGSFNLGRITTNYNKDEWSLETKDGIYVLESLDKNTSISFVSLTLSNEFKNKDLLELVEDRASKFKNDPNYVVEIENQNIDNQEFFKTSVLASNTNKSGPNLLSDNVLTYSTKVEDKFFTASIVYKSTSDLSKAQEVVESLKVNSI